MPVAVPIGRARKIAEIAALRGVGPAASCGIRSAVLLSRLAMDPSWQLRAEAARSPNALVPALEPLALDADWEVRGAVVGEPDTPGNVLEVPAREQAWAVRSLAEDRLRGMAQVRAGGALAHSW